MKYAIRRAKGVRWSSWHRMVTMRSLQLLVMNGVVRHAAVDPPQRRDDGADIEANQEDSFSMPPDIVGGQRWFARFFPRREYIFNNHERHTT